jgi:hypothetical protein
VARAGVEGRVQLRQGLLGFSKASLGDTKKELVETALHAGIIAKNVGQNTIATTPSSLSHEPKDNRIWTGRMYESYDADVTQTGRNIRIRWGWITKKARYFLIQEHGGFAFGKNVTPMFALANSKTAVEDYLKSKGIK